MNITDKSQVVLSVKDLAVGYEGKAILKHISFELHSGKILLLTGPNGSGKSTLMKTLAGLQPQISGHFEYLNKLSKPYSRGEEKEAYSYLPQRGLVFPGLTVNEHLQLTHQLYEEAKHLHSKVLQRFPMLSKNGDRLGGNLSGGQRKLLSFALLMLQNRKIWLLDEPLAGVDAPSRKKLVTFIDTINREAGVSFLIIEHRFLEMRGLKTQSLKITSK
jgi:ABC-type multidrug transport system ATPase subunit